MIGALRTSIALETEQQRRCRRERLTLLNLFETLECPLLRKALLNYAFLLRNETLEHGQRKAINCKTEEIC
jgi:hypothetical protein